MNKLRVDKKNPNGFSKTFLRTIIYFSLLYCGATEMFPNVTLNSDIFFKPDFCVGSNIIVRAFLPPFQELETFVVLSENTSSCTDIIGTWIRL